jgi:hypothetical protein
MLYLLTVPFISTSCYHLCHSILAHVNEVERTNGLISHELLTIQAELSRILESISPSPPLPLLPPSSPSSPPPPFHPPYPPEIPPLPFVPPKVIDSHQDGIYQHWILILWILPCILSMCYCYYSSSRSNKFNTLN